MIIGRKVSNVLRGPALRLTARRERCTDCLACTRNCPMSLDVNAMVRAADMEHRECILCRTCVDGCPQGAIAIGFGRLTSKIATEAQRHGAMDRTADSATEPTTGSMR